MIPERFMGCWHNGRVFTFTASRPKIRVRTHNITQPEQTIAAWITAFPRPSSIFAIHSDNQLSTTTKDEDDLEAEVL
jgi:hypothetical protein